MYVHVCDNLTDTSAAVTSDPVTVSRDNTVSVFVAKYNYNPAEMSPNPNHEQVHMYMYMYTCMYV